MNILSVFDANHAVSLLYRLFFSFISFFKNKGHRRFSHLDAVVEGKMCSIMN